MLDWLVKLIGYKVCIHKPNGSILDFRTYKSSVQGEVLMTLQRCEHCKQEVWVKSINGPVLHDSILVNKRELYAQEFWANQAEC